MKTHLLFAIGILTILAAPSGRACTTFSLDVSPGRIVANSLDWHQGHGMAFVNRRNQEKAAFTLDPNLTPARWVSKYGSVTLNQYGRELPLGGMNEAGLVIENMWLEDSEYPPIAKKDETVNEVQWIQYHLDRFATTEEVIKSAMEVKVANVYARIHYFVCDAGANCATIEFIKGRVVVHQTCPVCSKGLPLLTNDTYENSMAHLRQFIGFGGKEPKPFGPDSLSRFVRTAMGLQQYTPAGTDGDVSYAFKMLADVKQAGELGPSHSQWNLVYDRGTKQIHFRTLKFPAIKAIRTEAFDYSCKKPAMTLEMNRDGHGDATAAFLPYEQAANKKLIDSSFGDIAPLLPPGSLERLAAYPETLRCLE